MALVHTGQRTWTAVTGIPGILSTMHGALITAVSSMGARIGAPLKALEDISYAYHQVNASSEFTLCTDIRDIWTSISALEHSSSSLVHCSTRDCSPIRLASKHFMDWNRKIADGAFKWQEDYVATVNM